MRTLECRSARGPAWFRRWVYAAANGAWALAAAGCSPGVEAPMSGSVVASTPEAAGRYVVKIGGCNDCHTDGYIEVNGAMDESEWLTGSVVGFRGPWGTTYPPNLRLTAQSMTEDQWVQMLSTRQGLPPMPWPSVNHMADSDKRAVYRYLRSLGPKGEVRAASLAPDEVPLGMWFDFVPRSGTVLAASGN